MKSSFLKYFIFPVFFLLVFQGEGRGELGSGFGKEEQVLTAAKNHVNNLPSTGLALVKLTDAKAIAAQTSSLPPNKMFELIKSYTIGDPSEIDFVGNMNSIQGFYVKAAVDARSAGKMDDVATFYAALEQVRKYRQLEPLKDHIDAVSDLWQDVEKLDLFISDLASNENLLNFFKGANDATRLKYAEAWKSFLDGGVDDILRTNTSYLDNVSNFSTRAGKSTDEIVTSAKNNENGIEQFLDELEDTSASGHWDLDPLQRGRNIEDDLGQNLPETFKTIDKFDFDNGVATSIKSLDVDAKTYQNVSKLKSRLRKYKNELRDFTGHFQENIGVGAQYGNPITAKKLELAIPHSGTTAQMTAIDEIIFEAAQDNIELIVILYP